MEERKTFNWIGVVAAVVVEMLFILAAIGSSTTSIFEISPNVQKWMIALPSGGFLILVITAFIQWRIAKKRWGADCPSD